jgi:hypothetical protein
MHGIQCGWMAVGRGGAVESDSSMTRIKQEARGKRQRFAKRSSRAFCVRKVSPGRHSEVRGAIGRRRNAQGINFSARPRRCTTQKRENSRCGPLPLSDVIGRCSRAARRVTRDKLAEYRKQRRDRTLLAQAADTGQGLTHR